MHPSMLILAALIAMQSADAFGVAPPVLRPAGTTCCVCSAQCLAYVLQRAFFTRSALESPRRLVFRQSDSLSLNERVPPLGDLAEVVGGLVHHWVATSAHPPPGPVGRFKRPAATSKRVSTSIESIATRYTCAARAQCQRASTQQRAQQLSTGSALSGMLAPHPR
jgi:hypothetical protein